MLRRLLRDSAVYGLSAVLSRGIAFLLLPLYTWALAPREFGIVDMLVVLTALANVTVALEISQGLARFYPDAPEGTERVRYASTALWFTMAAFAMFVGGAFVAARPLAALLFEDAESAGLMRLAAMSIGAYSLFYFAQNQLRWELRPVAYAITSVGATVTTLLASVLLVAALRMGVAGVIWAQLAGNATGAALGLGLARRSFAPIVDRTKLAVMLRFSLPLVPSGIAAFAALYIDRIAILHLMTLGDVGVFGVGYRIASIVGLLMIGFQGALTPLLYSHYRDPETPRQLERIFRYFAAVALLLCVGLGVFASEIVGVVAGTQYGEGSTVVPMLAPAVLLGNMYIFAPGLAIAKRTWAIASITTMGAGMNALLNYTLIPSLGIRGAALATFLSAAAGFLAYMALSQRLYRVPHRWGRLGVGSAVAVAAAVGGTALQLPPGPGFAVKMLLVLTAAIVFVKLELVPLHDIAKGVGLLRQRVAQLRA